MKPQQMEKTQPLNDSRFRNISIVYLDILIRSLISFICIGIVFSIILIGYLHLSWVLVLPLVFIVSILVSPLLMKIKLGERVFDYYDGILKKTFKLE
jgi:phosphoglycerol transferase MdoB-like AlkP superfamily enzyme